MDEIILVFPDESLEEKAYDYKSEHFDYGETIIDGSSFWDKRDSYLEWLTEVRLNSRPETVNPTRVVSSPFFAVRKKDNKIIGMIDCRHYLNDFLKDFGHIGYSVRPTERRKGYATEILRLVLEYAKEIGLREVNLSCIVDNIGSRKAIIKNGGITVRFFNYNGQKAEFFRIEL